jgi:DNA polymerase-3 subunit beta
MQITTTKENLASPLALVAGAADNRGTVPLLGMVLLKATDAGQLSMICSDTGMLAKTLTSVEVKQGGEIAVDVRRFHDLIRTVPEKQPIEISTEGDKRTLLVKSGRSRFRLPTRSPADYPRMIPAREERVSITMDARRLADMIAVVASSMAEADLRHVLNGALFALDPTGLWIVATDSHRMTVCHEPIVGASALASRNVIVPCKTVLLAKKLLGQDGGVTLTLGAKNVQFTFADGTVLFGNAIDGQYPAWRALIPVGAERVTVSADRLACSLAMLAAAADDQVTQEVMKHKVELNFSKTTTTLRRGEAGLCELDSVSTSDAPHESAFNIKYLTDAVATIRSASEEIAIGYSPTVTPITIRPKDKDYPLTVLMPLRA